MDIYGISVEESKHDYKLPLIMTTVHTLDSYMEHLHCPCLFVERKGHLHPEASVCMYIGNFDFFPQLTMFASYRDQH